MAGFTWNETDTSSTNPAGTYCAPNGNGAAALAFQCKQGGTAGGSHTTNNGSTTVKQGLIYYQSNPGALDNLVLAAGTWQVQIDVTSTGSNSFTLAEIDICHLNASGTSVGVIASSTPGTNINAVQTFTFSLTGVQTTFGINETFMVCLLFTCNTASLRSLTFKNDVTITSPGAQVATPVVAPYGGAPASTYGQPVIQ